ncbi:uncharacterized protein MONOS_3358 [Monocercomonoides exilis]|uniref:uncharacterized protein n=1 Tax=Monocercomonoides exilis TaxID=2049356 RepID=UPI003559ADA4|nr:hypothetical protein MONOS_3358 [Monocercomonoides exilis]|eukprot:MONOS_3358.1-p1 / transcript=MONOS_3358.1 / gene=MONOS_3358 / organism=Monocercomonoides_exilis_PA203 / gene_product=unspecified product / transcript_product=unspecified product / location=Mono_scaffold00078:107365-108471(+) / protein_length=350 / sequence_SO=supercontig / SO=protein_coding / is_pseudo=false
MCCFIQLDNLELEVQNLDSVDNHVLMESLNAISELILIGQNFSIQRVINAGAIKPLLTILNNNCNGAILLEATKVIAHIGRGSHEQIEILVREGIVFHLSKIFHQVEDYRIQEQALIGLGNICSGSENGCMEVIRQGILDDVMKMVDGAEDSRKSFKKSQLRACTFLLSNVSRLARFCGDEIAKIAFSDELAITNDKKFTENVASSQNESATPKSQQSIFFASSSSFIPISPPSSSTSTSSSSSLLSSTSSSSPSPSHSADTQCYLRLFRHLRPLVHFFARVINTTDQKLVEDGCWGLSELSMQPRCLDMIIYVGVIKKIVSFIGCVYVKSDNELLKELLCLLIVYFMY